MLIKHTNFEILYVFMRYFIFLYKYLLCWRFETLLFVHFCFDFCLNLGKNKDVIIKLIGWPGVKLTSEKENNFCSDLYLPTLPISLMLICFNYFVHDIFSLIKFCYICLWYTCFVKWCLVTVLIEFGFQCFICNT